MVTVIFESHATSLDNESHHSSGWFDVELSPLGKKQAKELGERRKNDQFEVIFCSDLQRSYKTGQIAFGNKFPIIKDKRLRECDYGDLTRHPSDEVEPTKAEYINKPFPNGESYEDTAKRIEEFLKDLLKKYDGKKVMVIGHRATQYGLEHWINGVPLKKLSLNPFKWQPGWVYLLKAI